MSQSLTSIYNLWHHFLIFPFLPLKYLLLDWLCTLHSTNESHYIIWSEVKHIWSWFSLIVGFSMTNFWRTYTCIHLLHNLWLRYPGDIKSNCRPCACPTRLKCYGIHEDLYWINKIVLNTITTSGTNIFFVLQKQLFVDICVIVD